MNNLCFISLLAISIFFAANTHNYSTTAVMTLVGAHIKAADNQSINIKKYKRKDCPACKGKGWYMSGDGIKKIECQECEP